MRYLLNIFDLDGTLVDSHKAIIMAMNEVLDYYKMPPADFAYMKKLIGIPLDETFRRLGITNIDEAFELYRERYFPKIEKFQKAFHGVVPMLQKLKNRVLMSIATNKGKNGARMSLEFTGMESFFDIVITENEVKKLKPDPEAFQKILSFYHSQGIRPEKSDILMIGDSPTDIEFAYNCGIDSAFATWGFSAVEDLIHKPTYLLKEPNDLIGINGTEEVVEIETTSELDLHTYQPKEVESIVKDYLKEVRNKGFGTVRIVHGKGIGVQREMVRKILSATAFVKKYYDAPAYNGGFGATIAEIDIHSK